MGNYFSKQSLKAIEDLKIEEVVIEDLDGLTVRIRQLSSADMDRYQKLSNQEGRTELEKLALFVAFSCIDSEGRRVIDPTKELTLLLEKGPDTISRLFAECVKLDRARPKVDELLKNLQATPEESSSSTSA